MQGVHGRARSRRASRWESTRLRADVASPLAQPLGAAVSAMILLHLLEAAGMVETPTGWMSLDLGVDRGLGELLGYVICGSIIAGLTTLARREPGDRLLRAAAVLFSAALVDDLLMGHENAGEALGGLVPIPDPGSAALGRAASLGAIATIVVAAWRVLRPGASTLGREVVDWLVGALVVFGVFAVGIDLVHAVVSTQTTALDTLVVAVGDGGELLVLAAIASFVFARVLAAERFDPAADQLVIVDGGRIDLRPTGRAD